MLRKIVPILFISVCFYGCKLQSISYSFKGITLDPAVKTFSVDFFTNKTPFSPDLGADFTEALKSYLRSRTSLNELTDNSGDIHFEGQITSYTLRPVEIQRDEVASANRLTVTIRVKFTNHITEKDSFEQTFSHYEDIDVNENLDTAEPAKLKLITDKMIEDIFNKALVNW